MEVTLQEELSEDFYQCKFNKVLSYFDLNQLDQMMFLKLYPLRLATLFETQKLKQLNKELEQFTININTTHNFDYQYLLGTLHYFKKDYEKSRYHFSHSRELSDTNQEQIKSTISLADVLYISKQKPGASHLVSEIEQSYLQINDEFKIRLFILKANFHKDEDILSGKAKSFYLEGLSYSSKHCWGYFQNRCLLGLVDLALKNSEHTQLQTYFELLKAQLAHSEDHYLINLANEKLNAAGLKLDSTLTFSKDHLSLNYRDKNLSLSSRPKLFYFLESIYHSNKFLTKEDLSQMLWNDEEYSPETHDSRIFDLARRAKKLVNNLDNEHLTLVSGPAGYRLIEQSSNSNQEML